MKRRAVVLALLVALASAAHADPLSLEWNARLRHESVDDAAFPRDAHANTLRIRAGLRWELAPSLDAFVEGEATAAFGDDYNSGANRRVGYPGVADPGAVELNQATLRWRGEDAEAVVGRQRLLLDNQRWIGNSGWRQNEQTFDAVSARWKATPSIEVRYAWLDRVHRVATHRAVAPLARERRLDAHLVNAGWSSGPQRLAGYAYAVADEDVPDASTRTLGLRYVLAPGAATRGLGLTVEAARQVDHAASTLDVSHDYWLVEPAFTAGRHATLRAGWEHLGGDGRHALQTPLATLHGFNGWADVFLSTPPAGLEDRYVAASGAFARSRSAGALEWTLAFHDYRADVGNARYGREWNASLAVPFGPRWKGLAKLADYRADGHLQDVTRLWLQLEWSGSRAL